MKKIFLLLSTFIALGGCNKHQDILQNRTPVEKNFCYEIQYMNEKGDLVEDLYDCMMYHDTYGNDFQSAYKKMEPELEQMLARFRTDYQNNDMWDAEKLEIRKTTRPVRNAPNSKLEYTSIDFYMYNVKPYDDYLVIMNSCVIDSEGNVYMIQSGDD
ncbi:MAG: hypothetical protein IKO26_05435 [Paludibacteraceae bacterium]|nr:hypothetical protein [Paludibacteraceae bacterium]